MCNELMARAEEGYFTWAGARVAFRGVARERIREYFHTRAADVGMVTHFRYGLPYENLRFNSRTERIINPTGPRGERSYMSGNWVGVTLGQEPFTNKLRKPVYFNATMDLSVYLREI